MQHNNLPLHHLDSSIIPQARKKEDEFYRKKYINRLRIKYQGIISIHALGELLLAITRLEKQKDKYDFLDFVEGIIKEKEMEFYAPNNLGKYIEDVINADNRIKGMDAEIVACALEDSKVNNVNITLVTLDKHLVKNRNLEELGIRIMHPRNLI